MNNNKKFKVFLESLKGNGQDKLIDTIKEGFSLLEGMNTGHMVSDMASFKKNVDELSNEVNVFRESIQNVNSIDDFIEQSKGEGPKTFGISATEPKPLGSFTESINKIDRMVSNIKDNINAISQADRNPDKRHFGASRKKYEQH